MENNRPQRRACPRQQPVTKGRAHRAGNPRKEGDHPRLPTKPPHLIPCGRVFRVNRQERHSTALRHQGAVVLGSQPHCGGGAGSRLSKVARPMG